MIARGYFSHSLCSYPCLEPVNNYTPNSVTRHTSAYAWDSCCILCTHISSCGGQLCTHHTVALPSSGPGFYISLASTMIVQGSRTFIPRVDCHWKDTFGFVNKGLAAIWEGWNAVVKDRIGVRRRGVRRRKLRKSSRDAIVRLINERWISG
jgi:hypothetical protein